MFCSKNMFNEFSPLWTLLTRLHTNDVYVPFLGGMSSSEPVFQSSDRVPAYV